MIVTIGTVAALGCSRGGAASGPMDPTWERLLTIGRAYRQFNTANKKPPKQPADLLPILKTLGVGEETFSSLRDGQPFVVGWGVDLTVPPKWATSRPVLAYEKQGEQGKRYVLTTLANVELLTPEQFTQSSFPPGHAPE